jgi:Rod binding domain-containing protein
MSNTISSFSPLQNPALNRSALEKKYVPERSNMDQSLGDPLHLDVVKRQKDPKAQLKQVAQEMESLFVNMMWKSMKATVPKNDFLNGGQAEEIFDDMLSEERSRALARTGTFKVADLIYKEYEKAL